jgi:hypothetical protein
MLRGAYAKQLPPRIVLRKAWIVDSTGSIRLQRTQAEVDEAFYKLLQVSKRSLPPEKP